MFHHFISNKGEWNNCFSKFSNRVLPPIFISTILQSAREEKTWRTIFHDVKLRLLAHSRSFLANQKARNAIVGAENLLKHYSHSDSCNFLFPFRYNSDRYKNPKTLAARVNRVQNPLFTFKAARNLL